MPPPVNSAARPSGKPDINSALKPKPCLVPLNALLPSKVKPATRVISASAIAYFLIESPLPCVVCGRRDYPLGSRPPPHEPESYRETDLPALARPERSRHFGWSLSRTPLGYVT